MSEGSPMNNNMQTRPLFGLCGVAGALLLLGWVSKAMLVVALVIAFVVFAHELGHFIAARITGMKATEFFLGFGPRLFSFRKGETEFGVKPILAGAYVKLVGMTNLDEVEPGDESRAYRRQSYPKRLLVASAGSLMHFLLATLGLLVLFSLMGEPVVREDRWEVASVMEQNSDGSITAAASSGIRPGDRIASIDAVATTQWSELVEIVRDRPGKVVQIEVIRDGTTFFVDTALGEDSEGRGLLGIGGQKSTELIKYGPVSATQKTFTEFASMVGHSLQGIWSIVTNLGEVVDRILSPPNDPNANDNLETRPVSLVGAVQIGASDQLSGSERMQLFVAFNIFIGVFNLLPFLPLDGGHIAIATYERIREGSSGRRHIIDTSRLLPITYAVVAFLAFFGLGAIYLDIANPLGF
ncbi:MAG: RIP metalloprotease [Acidimicrobiales bacterium]|nr:RIP metalloprotease [Acidimicrobiales bacterium]